MSDIRRSGLSCPKCRAKLDEVARIAPLPKGDGLVAYACWACNYTTSEILHAREYNTGD